MNNFTPEVLAGLGFGTLLLFFIGFFLFFIIITFFYCSTLRKALLKCSEKNRRMRPGYVFFLFIPLFNIVWHFIVVIALSNSLHAEFRDRNIDASVSPGKTIGLSMCIVAALSILPFLTALFSIAYLILWIIYWIKISDYSKQLSVGTQV